MFSFLLRFLSSSGSAQSVGSCCYLSRPLFGFLRPMKQTLRYHLSKSRSPLEFREINCTSDCTSFRCISPVGLQRDHETVFCDSVSSDCFGSARSRFPFLIALLHYKVPVRNCQYTHIYFLHYLIPLARILLYLATWEKSS